MSSIPTPIRTLAGAAAMAVLLAGSFACTSGRDYLAETNTEPPAPIYEPATNTVYAGDISVTDEIRQEKETLSSELDQQLVQVDLSIEAVEDLSAEASATEKMEIEQTVDRMDDERERLVAEYQRINAATNENWEEVKNEVQEVIRQVSLAINELAATLDQ